MVKMNTLHIEAVALEMAASVVRSVDLSQSVTCQTDARETGGRRVERQTGHSLMKRNQFTVFTLPVIGIRFGLISVQWL